MLFPITEAYEKARKERDALVKSDGSEDGIMFFKQTIGNACGTFDSRFCLIDRAEWQYRDDGNATWLTQLPPIFWFVTLLLGSAIAADAQKQMTKHL